MKEPVTHILRAALPWRDPADIDTECGHNPADFAKCITQEEAVDQIKEMGIQRAGLFLCMTCLQTLDRWNWRIDRKGILTFEISPLERLGREGVRRREQTDRELRALGELAKRHPAEFEALINGQLPKSDRKLRLASGGTPGGDE